jgi:magnesium chelatase family protein
VRRYRWRVSGALYDRIDMAIDVPAVTVTEMAPRTDDIRTCEPTSSIRDRVANAYGRQIERQGKANNAHVAEAIGYRREIGAAP